MSYSARRTRIRGVGPGCDTSMIMYQRDVTASHQRGSPLSIPDMSFSSWLNSPLNQQLLETPAFRSYLANRHQAKQQQPLLQQLSSSKIESSSPNLRASPRSAMSGRTETPLINMKEASDKGAERSGGKVETPRIKKNLYRFKVKKTIKRRRQNARLRKLLQPKNAIVVLNELKTDIKFTFQEQINSISQAMILVSAEVDGKIYIGQGTSRTLAKQNAAENALKTVFMEKMAEMTSKEADGGGSSEVRLQDSNCDTPASDVTALESPKDDVPWSSIASFALHKLFTEWQSQGSCIPISTPLSQPAKMGTPTPMKNIPGTPTPMKNISGTPTPVKNIPGTPTPVKNIPGTPTPVKNIQGTPTPVKNIPGTPTPVKNILGTPTPMKNIPSNTTEEHPVVILNRQWPGVKFFEISREGTTPNLIFTLGVNIDGNLYTGVARNKKEAKKEAAKAALAGALQMNQD